MQARIWSFPPYRSSERICSDPVPTVEGLPGGGNTAATTDRAQPRVRWHNGDSEEDDGRARFLRYWSFRCGHWIVELTEKFLIAMGGWQAFKEARALTPRVASWKRATSRRGSRAGSRREASLFLRG